jgi:hypothetical protein
VQERGSRAGSHSASALLQPPIFQNLEWVMVQA